MLTRGDYERYLKKRTTVKQIDVIIFRLKLWFHLFIRVTFDLGAAVFVYLLQSRHVRITFPSQSIAAKRAKSWLCRYPGSHFTFDLCLRSKSFLALCPGASRTEPKAAQTVQKRAKPAGTAKSSRMSLISRFNTRSSTLQQFKYVCESSF